MRFIPVILLSLTFIHCNAVDQLKSDATESEEDETSEAEVDDDKSPGIGETSNAPECSSTGYSAIEGWTNPIIEADHYTLTCTYSSCESVTNIDLKGLGLNQGDHLALYFNNVALEGFTLEGDEALVDLVCQPGENTIYAVSTGKTAAKPMSECEEKVAIVNKLYEQLLGGLTDEAWVSCNVDADCRIEHVPRFHHRISCPAIVGQSAYEQYEAYRANEEYKAAVEFLDTHACTDDHVLDPAKEPVESTDTIKEFSLYSCSEDDAPRCEANLCVEDFPAESD